MKKNTLLLIMLFLTLQGYAHDLEFNGVIVKNGLGLGTVIAVVISWDRNKSVLFAILHGLLGWLYVIYYFIVKEK
ncbi:hypothetical protein Q4517_13000 [Tenacibaculum sp. 1_MG-2023]|nr:hypothetical protein [Tenacibaculum sp. 1_MG-2023]MDO6676462.1 hypothetical protein [Tenacibaculum sp. 1_MG-2023]